MRPGTARHLPEEAPVSLENVEAVRRGYEAFNRGDISAALEELDPDVEWKTYLVPGPGGGTYRGHDGVRELWSDARNIFGEFRNDPERIIDAGDRVVAFITVRGVGKTSGVAVKALIAHVFTLRDGKVLRVQSFEDRDEALKAAGLEALS
jgi:ketosteroid isomerase-like protein